jgi:protease I
VPGPTHSDTRIAILIEEGFSLREVTEARQLLEQAGAVVEIVAPSTKAPYRDRSGTTEIAADAAAHTLRASMIDALVIPGGHSPDRLRMRHGIVELVAEMVAAGKPVAAICHGPQVLITADVLKDRLVTCWPSIAVDVRNAGGRYVDRPAVRDGAIITGRKGADVPAVINALLEALQETARGR